jgi:hypothetical protein
MSARTLGDTSHFFKYSIDGDDDVPDMEDEWLSNQELADQRRRQQRYG